MRKPGVHGNSAVTTLRWLRVPGDTLFAIGAIAFVLFIFRLKLGYSLKPREDSDLNLRE